MTHRTQFSTPAWLCSGILLWACAGSTPAASNADTPAQSPSAPSATATQTPAPASPGPAGNSPTSAADTSAGSEPVECDLVCEQAKVLKRETDTPDYEAQANANVNAVLDSMRGDLLGCYQKRLKAKPTAHGFITARIVINPQGSVQSVETTGGAILGEATMNCIVERIKKGQFNPPHGGGTMTVIAPFSLRKMAVEDSSGI